MTSLPEMAAGELAGILEAKSQGAGKWLARCPAHADRTPSLSITEGPGGKVLLHCFAGCDYADILAALGAGAGALPGFSRPIARNGSHPVKRDRPPMRPDEVEELRAALTAVRRLQDTPGAEYLKGRGFDPVRAEELGTRWIPDHYGRPALCWGVKGPDGKTVALHGRHTDSGSPKCRTRGSLAGGVVWIPNVNAASDAPELALCEGPLDAMALHNTTCTASVALCGTTLRPWLIDNLEGRRVLLAFDADEAGDRAACEWAEKLRKAGAEPFRLRPPAKDWAEALETYGKERIRDHMPAPEPMNTEPVDDWPDPFPLDDMPNPPPFPIDALPHPLRDFAAAVSESTQTPPELPALVVLGACSTACARTARAEGDSGWTEPLNLFLCIVQPPGSRKSAVVSECVKPIEDFEAGESKRLGRTVVENDAERKTLEERLRHLVSKAAKCPEADRAAISVDRDHAARKLEEHPVIRLPRLLCDDATPESLSRLMTEQNGRIACLSAEGSIAFEHAGGRYAERGARLETYLQGHAGDTLRVDRVNRASEFVKAPALTLMLAVQPEVMRGAMNRPDFKGRGLLERFFWSVPESRIGFRNLNARAIPSSVQGAYSACIQRMLERKPQDDPPVLRLAPEAARVFRSFRERVEHDLRPGERFDHITGWLSKLPGMTLRIAGLLHLAERADTEAVSASTLEAAVRIAEYAAEHALIAYGIIGADPTREKAERLLKWIERNAEPEITARDAYHKNRAVFAAPGDVTPALALLCVYGYLQELPPTDGPGRPSRRFAVHPLTPGQNTQNTQNPAHDPNIGHSGHFVHSKPACEEDFEEF